jgi:hypothetical protein
MAPSSPENRRGNGSRPKKLAMNCITARPRTNPQPRALTGANEAGQAYVVIDGDIPHDACEIDEVRKAASQHGGPYPATFEPVHPGHAAQFGGSGMTGWSSGRVRQTCASHFPVGMLCSVVTRFDAVVAQDGVQSCQLCVEPPDLVGQR